MKYNSNILPNGFYLRSNVQEIAKDLLGKVLCTQFEDSFCAGMIVEVEAYSGRNDKACHANNGKRTPRTEVMYQSGGQAYVYLCYGIHHLFNVVTNDKDKADAILIRALQPISGEMIMHDRLQSTNKMLTNGPGILSKSMGINTSMNGIKLNKPPVWLVEGFNIEPDLIIETTRIGVDYAEEDAKLPWRYYIKGNDWVSKR